MKNNNITITRSQAKRLFWDVVVNNILFILVSLIIVSQLPWLWLAVVLIAIVSAVAVSHTVVMKNVLIPKRGNADDSGKGTN